MCLAGQNVRIVECVFYDGGMIKSAFAKRARGLMARYVCTHGIKNGLDSEVDRIKLFDCEGYQFSASRSSVNTLVFTRSPEAAKTATAANSAASKAMSGGKRKAEEVLVYMGARDV